VLPRLDRRCEDRTVDLVPDIVHQDRPVVQADRQETAVLGMEVEAHNARLCGENILWVGGVLETVAADEPAGLPHEVEAAVPVGKGERLRFRNFKNTKIAR
jgi:hypothetical protein